MNNAIFAYQALGVPPAEFGLGLLSGFAEPDANVQQIMEAVMSGQIHPATDIRLQIELRSKARKSRGERARVLSALRTIPGMYDPAELGDPGVSGKRHWEIGLPAGELWNLGLVPEIGTTRLAPLASQIAFFQVDAPRQVGYAPREGLSYPWIATVGWPPRGQAVPPQLSPVDPPRALQPTTGSPPRTFGSPPIVDVYGDIRVPIPPPRDPERAPTGVVRNPIVPTLPTLPGLSTTTTARAGGVSLLPLVVLGVLGGGAVLFARRKRGTT